MMLLDKDRIKDSLTEKDIELILRELGSQPPRKDNKGLIFQTICHNTHGGSFKLQYFKDSKMFYCFSGCSESFDIYELVLRSKRVKGIIYSFPQSVSHVANLTGKSYKSIEFLRQDNSHIIDDWDFIDKYKRKTTPQVELPVFDDVVLERFTNLPHESWLNEGISWATMKKYGIGYYIKDDKISMPHFDINGRLIGIRGRAMRQEDVDNGRKYMPLYVGGVGYNHQTAFNLYGLNHNKETIKSLKKIVLFEGEKSTLKCEDFYGEKNFTVAVTGSNISNFQRDLILSLGVREVIIAFDKSYDDAESEKGLAYARKIKKLANKFSSYCNVSVVWDYLGLLDKTDSPVDKGKVIFEELMRNKIEIQTTKTMED